MKWNLIVDVARCNNCNNCVLAVKDEYTGNDFPSYTAPQPQTGHRWFDVLRKERGQTPMVDVAWLPVTCNQCENAPCLTKATEGAVYRRPDGIVMIDPVKAAGRKDIVGSCPYGHIWWNEERQLPQKWSFDAHLLDQGWSTPRVVQVCPTDAIEAVKCSGQAMTQRAAQEDLQVLQPELGTRPHVYYKNLTGRRNFSLEGQSLSSRSGVTDCLEGAAVTLMKEGTSLAETFSDAFGDFRFDGLPAEAAAYTIRFSHPETRPLDLDVRIAESHVLGNIELLLLNEPQ